MPTDQVLLKKPVLTADEYKIQCNYRGKKAISYDPCFSWRMGIRDVPTEARIFSVPYATGSNNEYLWQLCYIKHSKDVSIYLILVKSPVVIDVKIKYSITEDSRKDLVYKNTVKRTNMKQGDALKVYFDDMDSLFTFACQINETKSRVPISHEETMDKLSDQPLLERPVLDVNEFASLCNTVDKELIRHEKHVMWKISEYDEKRGERIFSVPFATDDEKGMYLWQFCYMKFSGEDEEEAIYCQLIKAPVDIDVEIDFTISEDYQNHFCQDTIKRANMKEGEALRLYRECQMESGFTLYCDMYETVSKPLTAT